MLLPDGTAFSDERIRAHVQNVFLTESHEHQNNSFNAFYLHHGLPSVEF